MNQKVFIDTNVMVDLLAKREPFYDTAKQLFSLVDLGKCSAVVAAISFSTTAYLLERKLSYEEIYLVLRQFSSIVEIASIDERTVRKSLSVTSRFRDIEDAMQHYAAVQSGCDIIITRNVKDFVQSDLPVFSPEEFLKGFAF
ncbi:PIN domain-containing protein [Butyricimonas hominis]|uniref:type II toxin-antitoxin system VapC family toxin n=1 Tax=Butyricimonas TaxID=574697 RepID=UPI003513FF13